MLTWELDLSSRLFCLLYSPLQTHWLACFHTDQSGSRAISNSVHYFYPYQMPTSLLTLLVDSIQDCIFQLHFLSGPGERNCFQAFPICVQTNPRICCHGWALISLWCQKPKTSSSHGPGKNHLKNLTFYSISSILVTLAAPPSFLFLLVFFFCLYNFSNV